MIRFSFIESHRTGDEFVQYVLCLPAYKLDNGVGVRTHAIENASPLSLSSSSLSIPLNYSIRAFWLPIEWPLLLH